MHAWPSWCPAGNQLHAFHTCMQAYIVVLAEAEGFLETALDLVPDVLGTMDTTCDCATNFAHDDVVETTFDLAPDLLDTGFYHSPCMHDLVREHVPGLFELVNWDLVDQGRNTLLDLVGRKTCTHIQKQKTITIKKTKTKVDQHAEKQNTN